MSELLTETQERLERFLDTWMPSGAEPPRKVNSAIRFALVGGHRLRPLLMIAVARAFGWLSRSVIQAAAGIELIHTYLLVLDDVVDEARVRRGRPCCHVRYGEDVAQYACLRLSDLSLTLLVEAACAQRISCGVVIDKVSELRRNLIWAQEFERDLALGTVAATQKNLRTLYELKGGTWFAFITELGAVLAGTDGSNCVLAAKIGQHVGTAYQIQDDILDATGNPDELGKAVGMDKGLKNYVTVLGLAEARLRRDTEYQRAVSLVGRLHGDTKLLSEVIDILRGEGQRFLHMRSYAAAT